MLELTFRQGESGMAIKQVVVSDITGKEIPEGEEATLTVSDHPSLGGKTVELDIEQSEALKFESSKLNMVSIAIHVPGEAVSRVILDAAAFDKLFPKGQVEDILLGARSGGDAPSPVRRRGRPVSSGRASSPKAEKVDYTSPEHYGQLHRGRVTEEEAALVRDNLAQANKNRSAAGQPEIDPSDAKEAKRYGL
jgi:hypothetical protein